MPKIKYDIRNRFTNAVQCTVEIECDEHASESVKLGLAVRSAYLSDADLRGAALGGAYLGDAYLGSAYLSAADLRGANLRGAYLGDANLGGADLSSAYLGSAYLGSADLGDADLGDANLGGAYLGSADLGGQWIVQGPSRSDGYPFFLQKLTNDTEPMIKAGCRYFTVQQARQHWSSTRAETPLGTETTIIIDCLIALADARGLLTAQADRAAA